MMFSASQNEKEKFDGAGNAFRGCLGGVDAVAAIVLGGSAKVPAVNAVCLVDQDLCARWCQRCLVEIKGTVELCFGGEFGIDA